VCKQVLKHISILAIALWRKTFWFTGNSGFHRRPVFGVHLANAELICLFVASGLRLLILGDAEKGGFISTTEG
jgi:hypothetical protein